MPCSDSGANRRSLAAAGQAAHQGADARPTGDFCHVALARRTIRPSSSTLAFPFEFIADLNCELIGIAVPPCRIVSKLKENADWPPSLAPDFDSVIFPSTISPAIARETQFGLRPGRPCGWCLCRSDS